MTYRVGVVGLTQTAFIDAFSSMPDAEVTALCDINEDLLNKVGEEKGIEQRFAEFDRMAQADLEIVVLCTPILAHGPQAIAAMKNGKHVLCQYIAAGNLGEAEELLQAANASGRQYMFIETDCYERRNMAMKALAERGVFGDVTVGQGYYWHDCKTLGRRSDGQLTWRGEIWMHGHGGSVCAVHTAMPLLEIFGERVEEVYAYGPRPATLPEFAWRDRIFTACRLASGRVIELNTDIMSWHPVVTGYCLQGTRGCFEFDKGAVVEGDRLSQWKSLDELEEEFGIREVIQDSHGHGSAWAAIVHHFMEALRRDARPPQDLHDALHITAIGWAADESLATGQPVNVRSFD